MNQQGLTVQPSMGGFLDGFLSEFLGGFFLRRHLKVIDSPGWPSPTDSEVKRNCKNTNVRRRDQ